MNNFDLSTSPPPSYSAGGEGDDSPLGAYLADAERSFDSDLLGSPFRPNDDNTIARRKRPSPGRSVSPTPGHAPARIATALIPATPPAATRASNGDTPRTPLDTETHDAGPSRVAGSGGGRGSLLAPMPRKGTDNAFVGRFQYLVASSGLLEKSQLDLSKSSPRRDGVGHHIERPEPTVAGPLQSMTTPDNVPHALSEARSENMTLRWDIVGAVAVLVLSLAYVLGPVVAIVIGTAGAGGAWYLRPTVLTRTPPATPPRVSTPQPPSIDAGHVPIDEAPTTPTSAPADSVMTSLDEFLTESRSLDHSIATSLQVLAPKPDDTEQAHELRIALHRVMEDMTDSLAAATSTLVPMADRAALTVLEDMYDIPVTKPQRRIRHCSTDDENESPLARTHHVRPRASSSSATGWVPDLLTGGLLTPRERALAKSPIRHNEASPFDPNDKFTPLPVRTIRHRRASWSQDWDGPVSPLQQQQERQERDIEDDVANESVLSASSADSSVPASIPETLAPSMSPPHGPRQRLGAFAPKRASPLAQALQQLEGTPPSSYVPPSSFHAPFAVMQNRSTSAYRRSLQDIPYIHSSPTSSADTAANLALARASANMSSANRRSLQTSNTPQDKENMQEAIAAAGKGLQRARSLPQSQRGLKPMQQQMSPDSMRSSTIMGQSPSPIFGRPTGSTPASKRGSLIFAADSYRQDAASLGHGFLPRHIPRPSRVVSVSPLTLSGLKAAYLGVHLKRRRVACCLLGLRFDEARDGQYWDDVCATLQSLVEAITASKQRLEVLRADAEREAAAVLALATITKEPPVTPPRLGGVPLTLMARTGSNNFAPRDSTEQAILSSVDELQRTLARVWARCEDLRSRVETGETNELVAAWSDVRSDVGGMLRHVERGREAARRDWQSSEAEEEEVLSDFVDERPASPVPDFLRAWGLAPGPGAPEIVRPGDESGESEMLLPVDDNLPPPGMDEVYEATLPPAVAFAPPKAALSREERIALTREARARGLSLAQLTAASSASPAEREREAQRQLEAERLRAGGEMVAELQGMFGEIRRRKGMDD